MNTKINKYIIKEPSENTCEYYKAQGKTRFPK